MDPIYVYNSTASNTLADRIGVLKDVISAEYRETINFEKTLNFSVALDAKTSSILGLNTMYVCNGQQFDTASFEKQMTSDNTFLVNVSAEHVSYRLSEIDYIKSDISGPLWIKLERVYESTGSTGTGFEGRVETINSDNVPSVSVINGGANYLTGEVITIRGTQSGAEGKITIAETDQGRVVAVREPTEDELLGNHLPEAEWVPGIYSQQWTNSELGKNFSVIITSVSRVSSNNSSNGPVFNIAATNAIDEIYYYIHNRGGFFKVNDEIIVGDPVWTPENPAPYDTTKYKRRLAKMSVTNLYGGIKSDSTGDFETVDPNKDGPVGEVSNFVTNATIPIDGGEEPPNTGEVSENISYNFNMTGTLTQIVNEILYRTPFTLGEPVPGYSGQVTFTSNSTNVKALLTDFVDWIHSYGYSNSDLVFSNFTLYFYAINFNNSNFVFRSNNVSIISYAIDKHEKDIDGNYSASYSCQPIIFPEGIKLADGVRILNEDLSIDQTLRVSSLSFNPYDLLECEIEITNILKTRNILVSRPQDVKEIIETEALKGYVKAKNGGKSGVNVGGGYGSSDEDPGGGLTFNPSQAGEYLTVDKDGEVVTTQANDNLDPLIVNQIFANEVDGNTGRFGTIDASYIQTKELNANYISIPTTDLEVYTHIIDGKFIITEDPYYMSVYLMESSKDFTLIYGGEGYSSGNVVTVTGMISNQSTSITVSSVANNAISSFIINEDANGTFENSEFLSQNGGNTSGTDFKAIIRAVKNNIPIISMRSGGQNFSVGDIVELIGNKSHATISIKISAIRSGVITEIDSGDTSSLNGWHPSETATGSGGNGSGLIVAVNPYFNNNISNPDNAYSVRYESQQVVIPIDNDAHTVTKLLPMISQENPTDGEVFGIFDFYKQSSNIQYVLGTNNDVTVPEEYAYIKLIELPTILAMDHKPTQIELNYMIPGSIVFVYDGTTIIEPGT